MLPAPLDQLKKTQIKHVFYGKDEIIFRQGDKARGLFYVIKGVVSLRRDTSSGKTVVIHTAKAGETFAEASLFSPHYHCDAQAFSHTELIEVKKNSVLTLFSENTEFALKLTQNFATQIQGYRKKVELMAIRDATERVHVAFVEGLLTSDIKSFAAEIGLSHEVVYRSFATLVTQKRVVRIARGQFSLP